MPSPWTTSLAFTQVEPFFACMALFDVAKKRRISENFYFDLNGEDTRNMLQRAPPPSMRQVSVIPLPKACAGGMTSHHPTAPRYIGLLWVDSLQQRQH